MTRVPSDIPICAAVSDSAIQELLVVDADPYSRINVALLLSRAGYAVQETGNYRKAAALILDRKSACEQYRLLIVDMNLHSLALLKRLHMKKVTVPVLLITDCPDREILDMFQSMQNIAILVKPFSCKHLIETISLLLSYIRPATTGSA